MDHGIMLHYGVLLIFLYTGRLSVPETELKGTDTQGIMVWV